MRFDEYQQFDGLGLAELVARGEVCSTELVEIALRRMDAVNPGINAVVTRMDRLARQRAATDLVGPFAGVPFVLKDFKQDHAGVRSTCGSQALRDHTPTRHAEITLRWLEAGLVPIGVSNTPEFALKPQTESALWGPVHNPWRSGLSAGGSSGGSAAAVAAGIVPVAGGNDIGGSIRVPAALCGLFGFKPGRGRTPWGAPEAEIVQGACVQHVLTRSVRDSAALLDATHGPMAGAPFHIAPPERPYLDEVGREPGRLRIGFSLSSPLRTPVAAECAEAVRQTAHLLSSLGHEVEESPLRLDWPVFHEDFMTMMQVVCATVVDDVLAVTDCRDGDFEPDTRLMASAGRLFSAVELLTSQHRWHRHRLAWTDFQRRHDLWLTPTVADARLPLGALRTPGWQHGLARLAMAVGLGRELMNSRMGLARRDVMLGYIPFTPPANVLGLPAMSLPLQWTDDGMPVGVQLMGDVGAESLLFRVAGQVERAQPWLQRTARVDGRERQNKA